MCTKSQKDMSHSSKESDNRGILSELLGETIDVLDGLRRAMNPIHQIRPLSIAEAAKALRCRRQEVELLIQRGILPFIKRHGRRYILPADLNRRLREEVEFGKKEKRSKPHHLSASKTIDKEGIDPALIEFFE